MNGKSEGGARIVTMTDFTKDPEAVVHDVSTSGQSVILTQHGRFIALVHPAIEVQADV